MRDHKIVIQTCEHLIDILAERLPNDSNQARREIRKEILKFERETYAQKFLKLHLINWNALGMFGALNLMVWGAVL